MIAGVADDFAIFWAYYRNLFSNESQDIEMFVLVSGDIVSPHKTIRGMNKSILPDGINRYRASPLKLELDIKYKMLMINICSFNV